MNKKKYMTPRMDCVEMTGENILESSTNLDGVTDGGSGSGKELDANTNNAWNDLW